MRFLMANLRAFGVATLAIGVVGCVDRFPDYNYKITIYTRGKAFSSVRRVEAEEAFSILDSGGTTVECKVDGEAVILDVGGQTFYALLAHADDLDEPQFVAARALAPQIPSPTTRGEVQQAIDDYRQEHGMQDSFGDAAEALQAMINVVGAHDLPRTMPLREGGEPKPVWPMFVTFDDSADPKTIREVSPEIVGVSRITVEITDEDATVGIETRLPWLATHRGSLVPQLDGQTLGDMPEVHRLSTLSFVQRTN